MNVTMLFGYAQTLEARVLNFDRMASACRGYGR